MSDEFDKGEQIGKLISTMEQNTSSVDKLTVALGEFQGRLTKIETKVDIIYSVGKYAFGTGGVGGLLGGAAWAWSHFGSIVSHLK